MDKKIQEILSNIFEIDPSKITESFSRDQSDKWDSLNHIKLIISLEEEFNIAIEEDEMTSIKSYKDIWSILQKKGIVLK